MLTIYETPTFVAEVAKLWPTEERLEFFAWIAGEFCIPGQIPRMIRKQLEAGIEQEGQDCEGQ